MELSPCRVKFKGVDLGGTLSSVSIKPVYKKSEIKADQFGDSPLDRRVSGLRLTIETELTEVKNKDNWLAVFPHLRDTGSGSGRVVDFVSRISQSDLDLAGALLLHPLSLADSDVSGDFSAPLACASAESEYILGPDKQTVLKIVWNIYLDTSVTPAFLARYGDQSIVVTGDGIQAAGSVSSTDLINLTSVAVHITDNELAELINTGIVAGKNVAVSDPLGLRALQTADVVGVGTTAIVNSGPLDGDVCTFSGGA